MKEIILFGIKDNYADTRATYKELLPFTTSTKIYNIPRKYINTRKSYRNTYYFTNRLQASLFFAELEYKYNIGA